MNELVNFGEALEALKEGKKVARKGWNGKGMYLLLAYPKWPDGSNNITIKFSRGIIGIEDALENFIVMKTADNKLVPWLASQTDVLSEDWTIVE